MIYPHQITSSEIQSHHIERRAYSTDPEYTNIARNLLRRLKSADFDHFGSGLLTVTAINLSLHLEDTVADAGVWRSFCKEYHRLYGEWLPFGWTKEDFAYDELTLESCQFIVWMTIVQEDDTRYISPNTTGVRTLARAAFKYLDSIFEDTPINEELLHDLYSHDTLDDFIEVRKVLTWLSSPFGCYLSDWDVTEDNIANEFQDLTKRFKQADADILSYTARAWFPFKEKVGPLALLPQDWYAAMLETYTEASLSDEAQKVRGMVSKPYGPNFLEKETDDCLVFQGIDGHCFESPKFSFGLNFDKRRQNDNILFASFVNFDGVWNNNGMSIVSRITEPFSYYIQKNEEEKEGHQRAIDYFERYVATQNGRRLFYFDGIVSLSRWFEDEVILRNLEPLLSDIHDDMRKSKEIAVFLPTDGDPEFFWAHLHSIADPLNPFYDPEDDCAIDIFDNANSIHGECLLYMLNHGMMRDCRFYYGDTVEACHDLFQRNIDFLARFYRRGAY